jgi:hypothetical protein
MIILRVLNAFLIDLVYAVMSSLVAYSLPNSEMAAFQEILLKKLFLLFFPLGLYRYTSHIIFQGHASDEGRFSSSSPVELSILMHF